MRIGIPRETKDGERRVGATPSGVRALVADGHVVVVEHDAGAEVGFRDADYAAAGARLAARAVDAWDADLVLKVKEPQPAEYGFLARERIVLAYQQLGIERCYRERALAAGAICVGYEAVALADGRRPMLEPMSAIAGRLAPQQGAWLLQRHCGGPGVLLGSVPGVEPARVVILGAGVVGSHAARIAVGIGADVTVLAPRVERLQRLEERFGPALKTVVADADAIARHVRHADLVIGAVMVEGRLSPKLVRAADLDAMRPGAVLVDVGIDQGGIAETSRPTKHSDPTYVAHGVVHYCVPNMPAAVPRTATLALTQATLPYARCIAAQGLLAACRADPALAAGVLLARGAITRAGLAADCGVPHAPLADVLA